MLDTLKNIFGFGEATNFAQLIKDGAMIIDVRSPGEYSSGIDQRSSKYSLRSIIQPVK